MLAFSVGFPSLLTPSGISLNTKYRLPNLNIDNHHRKQGRAVSSAGGLRMSVARTKGEQAELNLQLWEAAKNGDTKRIEE